MTLKERYGNVGSMLDVNKVKAQAEKELEEERFRAAVDKYKERLKNKRSFWDIIFPFKIVILKKEDVRRVGH